MTRLALVTRRGWQVLKPAVVAAVVASALLGACGDEDGDRSGPVRAGPHATAAGEVTLRGTVIDVPGPQAAFVGRAGEEPSLVIFPRPTTVVVGSVVEVTGRVRTLRVPELEAELGTDLEPAIDRFEGLSCLVVSSVADPS